MPPAPSRPKRGRLRDRGDGAMQITVTFRHVDPTLALKAYAEEKLDRVKKYLRRPVDAHVILGVSKERHVAEITLKADHVTMFAEEETHDLYSAIDLAIDKLEHQAQKLHEKRRRHKGAAAERDVSEATTSVLAADRRRPGGAPEVIRTQRVPAKPLAVEEAVEQLAVSGDEFLVFTNASNQRVAVLYRYRRARGDPHAARAGQAAGGGGGRRAARRLGRRVPGLHQRVEPAGRRPLPPAGRQLWPDRAGGVMKITDILSEDLVVPALAGRSKGDVIEELADAVAERHRGEVDRDRLVGALEDREKLNSTALGEGVAIPHGKLPGLKRVIAAFGRSPGGVDFSSLDGKPTHLFFLLVAPEDSAGAHLKALARISRLLKDESFRQRLMRAATAADLYRTIREEDDKY